MVKYLRISSIYYIWLCNRSYLNFLLYEKKCYFLFYQCGIPSSSAALSTMRSPSSLGIPSPCWSRIVASCIPTLILLLLHSLKSVRGIRAYIHIGRHTPPVACSLQARYWRNAASGWTFAVCSPSILGVASSWSADQVGGKSVIIVVVVASIDVGSCCWRSKSKHSLNLTFRLRKTSWRIEQAGE
jgi:hypothetical protein